MTPYLRFLHHPLFSSPSEYNMCNFKNWIGPRLVIVFPALVGNYNIIPLFWPWFSLIIRLLYILQLTYIDVTLAVFFLEDNLNLRLINDKKILTMIIHSGMIWQVLLKPRHPSVPVIITSDSTNHQPGSIVRPHVGHLSGLYITPNRLTTYRSHYYYNYYSITYRRPLTWSTYVAILHLLQTQYTLSYKQDPIDLIVWIIARSLTV